MNEWDALIAFGSWEPRFHLSIARALRQRTIKHVCVFYFSNGQHLPITSEAMARIEADCGRLKVKFTSVALDVRDLAITHKRIRGVLFSPEMLGKSLLIDMSTMPRDILWTILVAAESRPTKLAYLYSKPASYGDWQSREPGNPRLVLNRSGLTEIGLPISLIVISGFDAERTKQLVRFFEPKNLAVYAQEGKQYENERKNLGSHREALGRLGSMTDLRKIDAYAPDHGLSILERALEEFKGTNIIVASLGPKVGAIACHRIERLNPSVALSYTPANDFNPKYSAGIEESLFGVLSA